MKKDIRRGLVNLAFLFIAIQAVFVAYLLHGTDEYGLFLSKDEFYPQRMAAKELLYKPGAPVLRIARPYNRLLQPADSRFGPGMEYELLHLFADDNNYNLQWLDVRSFEDARDALLRNRCDLIIGFAGSLKPDFAEGVHEGPVYAAFHPVIVQYSPAGAASSASVIGNGATRQYQGLPDAELQKAQRRGVQLMDPGTYAVLAALSRELKTEGTVSVSVGYRWFWKEKNSNLTRLMDYFWEHPQTKNHVAEMRERYLGFIPKQPRQHDLQDLALAVAGRVEKYSESILRAAEETRLDPLFLAAVIYQESRFDPAARSGTGVRGLMQITTDTARILNVDRTDPEQSILGGARYLRSIWDSLAPLELSDWDRMSLTLAAYNQGPGNMSRAVRYAENAGKAHNWTEMRQVYRSLADSGSGLRSGEAVSYVESVRYYYYVLSRLAGIASPEDKNFSSLLRLSASS